MADIVPWCLLPQSARSALLAVSLVQNSGNIDVEKTLGRLRAAIRELEAARGKPEKVSKGPGELELKAEAAYAQSMQAFASMVKRDVRATKKRGRR